MTMNARRWLANQDMNRNNRIRLGPELLAWIHDQNAVSQTLFPIGIAQKRVKKNTKFK